MKKLFVLFVLMSMVVPTMAAIAAVDKPIDCCKIIKKIEIAGEPLSPFIVNDCVRALDGDCSAFPSCVEKGTEKWGVICVLNVMNSGLNWVFVFLMILVVILTVLGAIEIMNTADPAKSIAGRNKIMMAAVGLLVALIARAVPSLVKAVLGY